MINDKELMEFIKTDPFKIKISVDGDQWSALLGDNIREGICGFGPTLEQALHHFSSELKRQYIDWFVYQESHDD
jgi:hypothetical protein